MENKLYAELDWRAKRIEAAEELAAHVLDSLQPSEDCDCYRDGDKAPESTDDHPMRGCWCGYVKARRLARAFAGAARAVLGSEKTAECSE